MEKVRAMLLGWLSLLAMFSGCARKEPTFQEHPRLQRLVPEVREAIGAQLTELYGTPSAPRTPAWLPLEQRGTTLTVRQSESGRGHSTGVELLLEPTPALTVEPGVEVEPMLPLERLLDFAEETSDSLLRVPRGTVVRFESSSGRLTLTPTESSDSSAPWLPLQAGEDVVLAPHARLRMGQRLYDQHCRLCHGITGDGDGPQSQILNPRPRDFRLGVFKYTSTLPGEKASTADLQQTIRDGIAGTGMPAFKVLGNHEIAQLTDYVKFLAWRGETEKGLATEAEIDFSQEALQELLSSRRSPQEQEQQRRLWQAELRTFLTEDLREITADVTQQLGGRWRRADSAEVQVEPQLPRTDPRGPSASQPEWSSLAHGRKLYRSPDLQCAACHGETGRGDGTQNRELQKKPDGSFYDKPGLHDDWGHQVKPRDLSYGVFHGGRDPLQIYRRIHSGVKGTPMPAYGGKGLTEADLWDLVNYMYYLAGDYPDIPTSQLEPPDQSSRVRRDAP